MCCWKSQEGLASRFLLAVTGAISLLVVLGLALRGLESTGRLHGADMLFCVLRRPESPGG